MIECLAGSEINAAAAEMEIGSHFTAEEEEGEEGEMEGEVEGDGSVQATNPPSPAPHAHSIEGSVELLGGGGRRRGKGREEGRRRRDGEGRRGR